MQKAYTRPGTCAGLQQQSHRFRESKCRLVQRCLAVLITLVYLCFHGREREHVAQGAKCLDDVGVRLEEEYLKVGSPQFLAKGRCNLLQRVAEKRSPDGTVK